MTAPRAVKKRSRNAATPWRAPKTARTSTPSTPSIDDLRAQLEVRMRERDEALEQLAATSKVLNVISSSTSELEPIFKIMIEDATRLCGAEVGTFALYEGSGWRGAAVWGHSKQYADDITRELISPTIEPRDK